MKSPVKADLAALVGSLANCNWLIMEKLSIIQVAELLKKEGFSDDVVDIFTDNAIDGKALKMLTSHEHMKELGLKRMGDRLKLENLISNYEETEELPPAEPPAEIIEMPVR